MQLLCPHGTPKRLLRGCSPHHHPRRWLVVNGVVLLWSAVLLARIVSLTKNNRDEKTSVEFSYLLYNFATCAVWLVEVFFNVLDHKGYFDAGESAGEESLLQPAPKTERSKHEVVALWVEAVLAAYFFIDSTTVAVHLSRRQIHRQAKGMTLDICFSMAAYSFLIYRQWIDWWGSGREDGIVEDREEAAEERSDGLV